jgi:predicted GNAT family N-acyltransferase
MAVLRPWRGIGVGSAILRALIVAASELGIDEVYLHAQNRAVPFYDRFGFEAEGDEFMEAGIPHRLMRRRARMDR